MSTNTYLIEFIEATAKDANEYAEDLANVLLDVSPDVEVTQKRARPSAQDFGATLVLVLGTPAAIAIAKALGDWLKLHHSVKITIKTKDGAFVGENLTAKDANRLVQLLQHRS